MGPNNNNLVPAIRVGQMKKSLGLWAPQFRFHNLLDNLGFKENFLCIQVRKFSKTVILKDISRRLPKLNKGVPGPNYLFKICYARMSFTLKSLNNSYFSK